MEAEDLREICEERSYVKSTLITTQLPPSHWPEVLPDPVLAEAIIDRFEGPGLVIKIEGDTYRPKKAKLAAGRMPRQPLEFERRVGTLPQVAPLR